MAKQEEITTRREFNDTRQAFFQQLAERLVSAGHTASWEDNRLVVNGYDQAGLFVRFDQKRASVGRFVTRPIPKAFYVRIGDYGNARVFSRLKDGGWNWDGIIPAVLAMVADRLRHQRMNDAYEANRDKVKHLAEQLGINYGYGQMLQLQASSTAEKPVKVLLRETEMTLEQAKRLYAALRTLNEELSAGWPI